ncbi:flagellar hook-associated protein FlgK [Aquibium sp. LZ166]|uniref:Flagellar hook-associated protein 1 n=1 Tax=Aquibium pacificus TaxID=3153579 RepID=A0ABV3SBQ3_9HYPH
MSLSTALSIAQNALLATSRRTSVVSQNITNADNADYSRRSAVLTSTDTGVRVSTIQRAANAALEKQNLSALSQWEGQQGLLSRLNDLALAVNGSDNASSAATALGKLQEALQLYAATPSSANLAEGALDAARQVVRSLNEGSAQIQSFRADADAEIGTAVDDLNKLLADFETANKAVIAATSTGRDANTAMDQRNALLRQIAEYVPISTFTRANSDMVITTADGSTLFETVARQVSFEPTTVFGAGIEGNAVYIDGVPLSSNDSMSAISGKLGSLIKLRDEVAVTFQSQLDEIARGTIQAFAETDQSGGGASALAGLFTWSGGPALPAAGSASTGLAADISVNAAFDSDRGGDPTLLRDGGANGTAYRANSAGASYSALLIKYGDAIDKDMSFDAGAGIATSVSLSEFTANSVGWIEGLRQNASRAELTSSAMLTRTQEALSSETGVNVDVEMTLLLDLEHAYEASARILRTVDEMLGTLLDMA